MAADGVLGVRRGALEGFQAAALPQGRPQEVVEGSLRAMGQRGSIGARSVRGPRRSKKAMLQVFVNEEGETPMHATQKPRRRRGAHENNKGRKAPRPPPATHLLVLEGVRAARALLPLRGQPRGLGEGGAQKPTGEAAPPHTATAINATVDATAVAAGVPSVAAGGSGTGTE